MPAQASYPLFGETRLIFYRIRHVYLQTMDPRAQASFIPKKPLVGGAVSSVAGKGIVWIVSLFLFVVAVIGAVSVFLYQQYLTNHITTQSQTLAQAQAAFDPSAIT